MTAGLALQSAQYGNRGNCGASKLGRNVVGDTDKAQNINVQHLTGLPDRFQILAAVVPQPKVQTFSGRGLFDDVHVTFELVADCGSNEIRAVRVEPFLHHQVDVTKIDITEIDRDFLGVRGLWPQCVDIARHHHHPFNICRDGIWMCFVACQGPPGQTATEAKIWVPISKVGAPCGRLSANSSQVGLTQLLVCSDTVERLYLDFDGFFASVEQLVPPHLRERPVGVVPFHYAEDRGILIAYSRDAKQAGIKNVMDIFEARDGHCAGLSITSRADRERSAWGSVVRSGTWLKILRSSFKSGNVGMTIIAQ